MKESWLHHLELLKEYRKSEIWLLCGIQGCGKTSTALGMLDILMKDLKWIVTADPKERADVLYWDDIGKHFHKHRWNTKLGKEVGRFVEVVRGQYTLILGTAPRFEDLHISIRESDLLEVIDVITNGVASWRDIIRVPYIMPKDESWRFQYGKRLSKIINEED